jgi:hypothetical protein
MDAVGCELHVNRCESQTFAGKSIVFDAWRMLTAAKGQMGAESGPNRRAAITREVVKREN